MAGQRGIHLWQTLSQAHSSNTMRNLSYGKVSCPVLRPSTGWSAQCRRGETKSNNIDRTIHDG